MQRNHENRFINSYVLKYISYIYLYTGWPIETLTPSFSGFNMRMGKMFGPVDIWFKGKLFYYLFQPRNYYPCKLMRYHRFSDTPALKILLFCTWVTLT